MTHKIALLFVNLDCVKDTGESGNDEIYFKIWTDDQWYSNYPLHPENGDVFKMTHKDNNMRQLDLDMTVNYGTVVRIELREPDKKKKPQKDEILGNMYLHTDDIPIGDTSMKAHNYQEFKKTHYIFRYRIVSHRIPTVRLLGVYCQ
ncbi:uncharacterized protein LOC142335342 [Convolutriloba macropyga]|uniref:uncharacterized protein LOC142335342 n=1 Tax=Convolutriloba macropyga TaxID=536237 RepID=UPI003F521BE7